MDFIHNIQEIRERARQQIANGAVTRNYELDPEQAIGVLNEALATEIVCTLRYWFHYYMATGIHSQAVKEEFGNTPERNRRMPDALRNASSSWAANPT